MRLPVAGLVAATVKGLSLPRGGGNSKEGCTPLIHAASSRPHCLR